MSHTITMRPIGIVESLVPDEDVARQRRTMISAIKVFEEFEPGLTGITDYSHITVLFWMDRATPSELLIRPRGNSSLPLTGVLASRGRGHPNPIGLAVVELLEKNGSRLTVRRLDAYSGTPIIDIKPYDFYDVVTDIKVPQWFSDRAKQPPTGAASASE